MAPRTFAEHQTENYERSDGAELDPRCAVLEHGAPAHAKDVHQRLDGDYAHRDQMSTGERKLADRKNCVAGFECGKNFAGIQRETSAQGRDGAPDADGK